MYLTAHSGSDQTPENSLAFANFFKDKKGIDVIEVDVRCNPQGELVLSHDALEKKEYVRLSELLLILEGTTIKLNCDLKEANLEQKVYQLAQKNNQWSQIYLSGNVSLNYLKNWPEQLLINLENFVGHQGQSPMWDEDDACEKLEWLGQQGARVINLSHLFYTERIARKGNELELSFSLWTVDDLADIRRYQDQGIFNVTTRRAMEYLNQQEVFR